MRVGSLSRWTLGATLVGAMTLAGCTDPNQVTAESGPGTGDAATASAPAEADEVVIAPGSEPDTLDPLLGYARWGDDKVTEGLVRLTEDLKVEPLLATGLPEISEDGLTYTFTLREGVTFHDGSPLTADDVAFTYQAAMDPKNASPVAADLTELEKVEVVDEHTVRFTLDAPHSGFVTATVLGIVPRGAYPDGDLNARRGEVLGTGPYRIATYRKGERLVLEAYEDYWGEQPQVRRATFVFGADDARRVASLASGEVDGALLPAPALARFEEDPAFQVVRRDTADFRALVMPEEHPVAGDPAIREALDLGIDRDALVEGALAGAGRPAFGPIPPEAPEYSDVVEVETDRQAAEETLEDAGWVEGSDGVREKDGQRAEMTLMYPAGDTLRQNVALEVQAQAEELGIDVEPEGLSWDAIEPRMAQDPLVYGTGNPYDADLSTYPLFHSSRAGQGFDNPGGYRSPAMDRALEEGRIASDEAGRVAAYQEVQSILAQDRPWIFLAYVGHDYVIRADRWAGYDVDLVEPHEHGLQGGPWWNLADWTSATR